MSPRKIGALDLMLDQHVAEGGRGDIDQVAGVQQFLQRAQSVGIDIVGVLALADRDRDVEQVVVEVAMMATPFMPRRRFSSLIPPEGRSARR